MGPNEVTLKNLDEPVLDLISFLHIIVMVHHLIINNGYGSTVGL